MDLSHVPKVDRNMPPDPRMEMIVGGWWAPGQHIPMNPGTLRRLADKWPTTDATPDGVAGLLTTSRNLYVASYYSLEFLSIAVAWSLFAVEAALRIRLERGTSARFEELVNDAHKRGLLDDSRADSIHAGRKLRGDLSHPEDQDVWTYGMAGPSIGTSHEVVALLFPRLPTER